MSIKPKQAEMVKENEAALPTQDDVLVVELMSALKDRESKKLKPTGSKYKDYSSPVADPEGVYAYREPFLADLAPIAKEVASELGIDPRIVMAQAILETGWGRKVNGNNYFGIKGKGQEFTTHEEVDGLMVKQKDGFRTYDSLEDSVRDYGKFLKENKRYKPLLEANSFDEQIEALAGSGYATDSRYGEKVKEIALGDRLKSFSEIT
jgi:flagellum-specific peptidoglycan hydrolase FlgJ